MKLRIEPTAVRLRLDEPEVERLAREGRLIETCPLGPGLRFGLQIAEQGQMSARYDPAGLLVTIPRADAQAWASGRQITLRAVQPTSAGQSLEILVEKDLPRRGGEPGPRES